MVIFFLPPVYQKKHLLFESIERHESYLPLACFTRSRLWRRIEARGERPQGGLNKIVGAHTVFPSEKWWIKVW